MLGVWRSSCSVPKRRRPSQSRCVRQRKPHSEHISRLRNSHSRFRNFIPKSFGAPASTLLKTEGGSSVPQRPAEASVSVCSPPESQEEPFQLRHCLPAPRKGKKDSKPHHLGIKERAGLS